MFADGIPLCQVVIWAACPNRMLAEGDRRLAVWLSMLAMPDCDDPPRLGKRPFLFYLEYE